MTLAELQQAIALYQAGDIGKAEPIFAALLARDTRDFMALQFLGKIALEKNRLDDAAELMSRALAVNPRAPRLLADLGTALEGLNRPAEALSRYDQILALGPDAPPQILPLVHYNRGSALRALGRHAEALAAYDRAIALMPDFAQAHANRAVILLDLKRLTESVAGFEQAVALDPGMAGAWYSRGNALKESGRLDDAIASYDRALARRPDYPQARTNRSFCHLLKGDVEKGLADYEFRQANRNAGRDPARHLGHADLNDLAGKTVLVRYEIGLGDTIQYCRYLPLLAAKGAKILFAPQASLRTLMATLDTPFTFVERDDQSLVFDYWVNIISLHLLFQDEIVHQPAQVPYLQADPARVALWRQRLGDDGFKIAVCWQSAGRDEVFAKAFPPSALARIARLPGVRLIGVNKDIRAEPPIEDPGPDFDSGPDAFADAAAVLEACDLVISSDTGLVHLAGALARPAWVALKQIPDCRWGLHGDTTPLYPTLQLFRQKAPDGWASVFADMESRLKARLD